MPHSFDRRWTVPRSARGTYRPIGARLALAALLSPGCAPLFAWRTTPLSIPLENAPVVRADRSHKSGAVGHVEYHSAVIEFHSNAIGDLARRLGLEEVYYADLESLIILGGAVSVFTVHLYGRAAP